MKTTILYEGPFLIVSALIFSLWISVGMSSHLGWFKGRHPLRPSALRSLRVHWALSIAFLVLFVRVATLDVATTQVHMLAGLLRILGAVLLIQGTVVMSDAFHRKHISRPVRALFYTLSILLGFYALIGLGVLAPIYFRRVSALAEIGGSHESHSEAESRKIG